MVIAGTRLSTDMSAFLPGAPTPAQQVMLDQMHDGAVSRLIVVGVEGAAPDVLAAMLTDMAATLRQQSDFILVEDGEPAAFKADRDFLWDDRYLLSPAVTADRFSVDGLHASLERDLTLLRSELSPVIEPMLPGDPTGEMLRTANGLAGASRPAMHGGVWASRDGKRAVMLLRTRAPGFDIDAQQHALDQVQAAFGSARQIANAPDTKLLESGPGVFSVHGRNRMKADATRFSTIATVLVAAILLAAYRSPRALVLALLPVATGALTGMAAVSLCFGFVHGITLGFGVTLIGEAVDYAIYLFTQGGPGSPPRDTLRRIWPTLRLGMLTSVFGFAAMLFSSFTGFAQLGLFTVGGLVAALGVTRYVLPALVPSGFSVATAPIPLLARAAAFAPRLRLPLLAAVLAGACLLCLHRGGFWEDEITSLSPLSPAEQALDKQLRADVGAPDLRYMIALSAPDRQAALRAAESVAGRLRDLVDRNALGGFDSPAAYLPSDEAQRARRSALPSPEALRANLDKALAGLPFKPGYFAKFLGDVEAARTQQFLTEDSLKGTGLALKLDSLLLPRGDGWKAIVALYEVKDVAAVEAVLGAAPSDAVLLDMKGESDGLLHIYRREAITLSLVGSLAIVLLLALALRSTRRVVRVLMPLAAAIVVVLALITTASAKLSIFNLFGLLLTVAIGSNYCLFFERETSDPAQRGRTIASLALANLCTVIGFGILSFSSIPVLHGIGGTVAVGAFLSLVFGAIVIGRGMETA